MKRAVFLDRDGTINYGVPRYERVDSLDKVELISGVVEALRQLATLEYTEFFVTNQAGIAEGLIDMDQFDEINSKVLKLIAPSGIKIEKTYVCPHGDGSTCDCRKPKPKLLQDAAKEYDIDLSKSWMLGDRPSDVMTGANAGTKTILVRTGVQSVEAKEADYVATDLGDAIDFIAKHEL